jgi:hypothetical protein
MSAGGGRGRGTIPLFGNTSGPLNGGGGGAPASFSAGGGGALSPFSAGEGKGHAVGGGGGGVGIGIGLSTGRGVGIAGRGRGRGGVGVDGRGGGGLGGRPPVVFKIPKKKSSDGKTRGQVENVPQLVAPLQLNVVQAHLDNVERMQELKSEMAILKRQQRIWDESAMFDLAKRGQKILVHGQHHIKMKTIREQPQFTLEKLSPGMARYMVDQGKITNPRDALIFSVAALQFAAKTQERKLITRIEIKVPTPRVQKERKTKRTAEFVADLIEKKQRQKLNDSLATSAHSSPSSSSSSSSVSSSSSASGSGSAFFAATFPPSYSSPSASRLSSPSPQSAFGGGGGGSVRMGGGGGEDAEGENHGMSEKGEGDEEGDVDDEGREVADD